MTEVHAEKNMIRCIFYIQTLIFIGLNAFVSSKEIYSSITGDKVAYFFFVYTFLIVFTMIATNVVCFFLIKIFKGKNLHIKELSYDMIKYIYNFYVLWGILILLLKVNIENFNSIINMMKIFKFIIINFLMYSKIFSKYDIEKRKKLLIFFIWVLYSFGLI